MFSKHKTNGGTHHHENTDAIGPITGMALATVMIGCMVIICKLLSQLEDADEKRDINNAIAQSLENPQPPSGNLGRPNDQNSMAPRPAVIRQSWMGTGMHMAILNN